MTENTVPLVPAGWYPDPEVPGQMRWWDGSQWYASTAPPRVGLGDSFRALSSVLVGLLVTLGVLYLVLVGLYVWGLAGLDSGSDVPMDAVPVGYLVIEAVAGLVGLLVLIATVVVWCIWQFRLARAANRDEIRRSPGMHVGSWFIPVVFWWFPFQNIKDLWAANGVSRVPGLLGVWWTLWVITNLTGNLLGRLSFGWADPSAAEYNLIALVDAAMWPPMVVLAVMIVRRLSDAAEQREHERATAGS